MIYDKTEKHPINVFLTEQNSQTDIDIYSNQMLHITSIPLQELEAFVISEQNDSIFALQFYNMPNVLLESVYRSELLVHLISEVERYKLKKFKIFTSKKVSTKQHFALKDFEVGTYEDNLTDEEIQAKKKMINDLLTKNVADMFK